MDSRQSGTKRNNFNKQPLQHKSALTDNEEGENAEIKRRKLETNPFKIGSVLEKVFSFLDAESLKNARQVNTPWSIEGGKMLINKCFVKIPMGLRIGDAFAGIEVLDQFRAFLSLKSNEVSMIPSIKIKSAGDLKQWKYLGVLGQKIISIKLIWNKDVLELIPILLDLMPNLTHLYFASSDVFSNFGHWYEFNNNIKVLNSVMSTAAKDRKPMVMVFPELSCHPRNVEELDDFEKFVDCNKIMTWYLRFSLDPFAFRAAPQLKARVASVVSKLLSGNQSVIKWLSLFNCEMYLLLVEFPLLSSLQFLTLKFCPETPGDFQQCKFSPSIRFSEKVPKLNGVEIKYDGIKQGLNNDFFGNLFEHTRTAPSVKYLKYSDFSLSLNMDSLLQTFPNIEKFESKQTGCSEAMFRSIWKHGKNIEDLNIDIKVEDVNHRVGDLDYILTGFSPGTVEKMRKSPKLIPYIYTDLKKLRVNSSILDLKGLKKLYICIHAVDRRQELFTPEGMLALARVDQREELFMPDRMFAVAGEYVFKLMPKETKINIVVSVFLEHAYEHARKVLKEAKNVPNIHINVGPYESNVSSDDD